MKKVISAAAAVTLLSTGAFAFESLTDGTIVTKKDGAITSGNWFPTASNTVKAKYKDGVKSANVLEKSTGFKGDALIFPAFSQKTGFKTEIVVKNPVDVATVAKVVIHSADSTREVMDFNVYLSANDSIRFTIKDGKVVTSDDSIVTSIHYPHKAPEVNGKYDDAVTTNTFGNEFTVGTLTKKTGYITVYAMAQSDKNDGYHKKHAQLVQDYRHLLDEKRDGWRPAFNVDGMKNGMMLKEATAPNVSETNALGFEDPKENLTGTVKITRDTKGMEATMLLPATALANYTDGNMMLWTEGEYAAIQDRNIVDGKYSQTDIEADAAKFVVTEGVYSFEKGTSNNLLFTQPFKRILVQLGDTQGYYKTKSGWNYKGFAVGTQFYNEDESFYTTTPEAPKPTTITSPHNSGEAVYQPENLVKEELAVFTDNKDLQNNPATNGFYKGNGFGYVKVGTKGIPAIATQWVGSDVNGKPTTNWIYAPIK